MSAFANDPFNFIPELEDALANADLKQIYCPCPGQEIGSEAYHAAYMVAVALGMCRRARVDLPEELDFVLPPELAIHAAWRLHQVVLELKRDLEQIAHEADIFLVDDGCAYIIEDAVKVWAAILTITEAVEAEPWQAQTDRPLCVQRASQATDAMKEFLREKAEFLSRVAESTNLIKNYRVLFQFENELPWFLNGTLDDIAKRLRKKE